MRLLFLPMPLGFMFVRKPRDFYPVSAVIMGVTLLTACAWLVAPIGLWQSLGLASTLLWLIPTALVVFGMGKLNHLPGGA